MVKEKFDSPHEVPLFRVPLQDSYGPDMSGLVDSDTVCLY